MSLKLKKSITWILIKHEKMDVGNWKLIYRFPLALRLQLQTYRWWTRNLQEMKVNLHEAKIKWSYMHTKTNKLLTKCCCSEAETFGSDAYSKHSMILWRMAMACFTSFKNNAFSFTPGISKVFEYAPTDKINLNKIA